MEIDIRCMANGCSCELFEEDLSQRINGTTLNPICKCGHKRTTHRVSFRRET